MPSDVLSLRAHLLLPSIRPPHRLPPSFAHRTNCAGTRCAERDRMLPNARLQNIAEQAARVGCRGGQDGQNGKGQPASASLYATCKGLSDTTDAISDRRPGSLNVTHHKSTGARFSSDPARNRRMSRPFWAAPNGATAISSHEHLQRAERLIKLALARRELVARVELLQVAAFWHHLGMASEAIARRSAS